MPIHESIMFYNPTDENFVGTWDGESYDLPAKSTKHFATHVAEHFAKHLANKILNERFENLCKDHSKPSNDSLKTCKGCQTRSAKLSDFYNVPEREALYKIILPKDSLLGDSSPKESPTQ